MPFHRLGIGVWIDQDLVGGMGSHRPTLGKAVRGNRAPHSRVHLTAPRASTADRYRFAALTHERDVALEVMDGLTIGILFVTSDARVLFANRVAERALQNGHGLSVSRAACACRIPVSAIISSAWSAKRRKPAEATARKRAARSPSRPQAADNYPFDFTVPVRCPSVSGPPDRGPDLFRSGNRHGDPRKALQTLFGLTPAQARLVIALLAGQSLTEYAQSRRHQHQHCPRRRCVRCSRRQATTGRSISYVPSRPIRS